ncbi:hypothetical protein D3C87_1923260 [compost metagenome]
MPKPIHHTTSMPSAAIAKPTIIIPVISLLCWAWSCICMAIKSAMTFSVGNCTIKVQRASLVPMSNDSSKRTRLFSLSRV